MKRFEVDIRRTRLERIVIDAETREDAMVRAMELAEEEPSWFQLLDEEIKSTDAEEVLLDADDI